MDTNRESSPEAENRLSYELNNWQLIRRLLLLSWEYRWGCVKVLSLQVLLLMFALSGIGFIGLGIDFIRNKVDPSSPVPSWPFGFLPLSNWSDLKVLAYIAGFVVVFALSRCFMQYLFTVELSRLVQGRLVVDLRQKIYDKMQRLSFRFFDDNESGSIINRVTRDVQATRMFIDQVLVQGLAMLLTIIIYTVFMIRIHFLLTLVCMITLPALWYSGVVFSRIIKPAYRLNRELVDKLILTLSESIQGIRIIKGFAREGLIGKRFARINDRVRKQSFWIFRRVSLFSPFAGFLAQVNIVVLIAYGGYLVINNQLALGSGLVVFSAVLQQFSSQVSAMVQLTNSIQQCLSAARRVFEVLDTPIEIKDTDNAKTVPHRMPCSVEFSNVTFGYESEEPVLKNVSFRAEAGECIAILGATGAGKSSLLNLIPRFYDPGSGSIRVNGVDIRDFQLDSLRRNIGIVFQENFLFSNEIKANIAFGHHEATDEQIIKAAKVAAAHDFIMEMPNGYETILGEKGKGISGGQRQRLAIARAILLEPAIILLDDPTAAIDAETEHEIMNAMENAMKGRTTFIVAHRLSSLKRADKIIVLERGRIVQFGRHEQLMKQVGPYQKIVELQVVDSESKVILEKQGVDMRKVDEIS